MNDPCPVCGLLFRREEGYFLGAMYVSYGISTVTLIAMYFLAAWLVPGWPSEVLAAGVVFAYLPFTPVVFRYARVVWIYYDQATDPHGALAGTYEKTRLREIAHGRAVPPLGGEDTRAV
jgi:hypothetical protein